MPTLKDMMSAANEAVPRLTAAQSAEMIKAGSVTILDVRDGTELQQSGKIKNAVHVARGSLEFRCDPDSPTCILTGKEEHAVLLYCGGGGRAALAGKTLKELGYQKVFNAGGFKELADAGIETEKA